MPERKESKQGSRELRTHDKMLSNATTFADSRQNPIVDKREEREGSRKEGNNFRTLISRPGPQVTHA